MAAIALGDTSSLSNKCGTDKFVIENIKSKKESNCA